MSRIRIFNDTDPSTVLLETREHAAIARELGQVGVRFEQWQANAPVAPGASQDEVIAAYKADIDRLMAEGGYKAVDVISLTADHPQKDALRQKFLVEGWVANFTGSDIAQRFPRYERGQALAA